MKKTPRVVGAGAIAAVVSVFGVGYGVAAARDEPREGTQQGPECGQMQESHKQMARHPRMRRMHDRMMRDPEMRRMHDQMMGGRMGMAGHG